MTESMGVSDRSRPNALTEFPVPTARSRRRPDASDGPREHGGYQASARDDCVPAPLRIVCKSAMRAGRASRFTAARSCLFTPLSAHPESLHFLGELLPGPVNAYEVE